MPSSLVTGAAGFVGQAIARALVREGERVRALVPPGDPRLGELRAGAGAGALEIVEADIRDAAAVVAAARGVRRIYHTAAMVHSWAPYETYLAINLGGARNVARAALEQGVERLLHVSTSDVFGVPAPGEKLEEGSPFRRWGEPYQDSKIEAEQWLWSCRRERGLPLTVIYPGWVYGPGDHALFPGLAAAIAAGTMFFWGRDVALAWAHVDNLADACLLAAAAPQALGEGYLIHDGGSGPTLEELSARIAAIVGAPAPARRLPYAVVYAAAAAAQLVWRALRLRGAPPLTTADVKAFGHTFQLSNEKARTQLGWTPRIPVATGMEEALAAFAARRAPRGEASA